MALSYDLNAQIKDLESIIVDYTEWFLEATRLIFYPFESHESRGRELDPPPSFSVWMENAARNGSIDSSLITNLGSLHHDLCAIANTLMRESAQVKKPPPFKEYDTFAVLFEEFAGHVRRLEIDSLMENGGIDPQTGLRSVEMMESDIRREMDRLARQGKTFSLALVRIDDFDKLKKEMTPDEAAGCVRTVADMVKKCMRSFDDAYHVDDMFVLSLKQTGVTGGIRALKRLKSDVDQSGVSCTVQGKPYPLSLSSCVGAPNENDDVMTFIEHLKKDLGEYQAEKGGGVVEYFEMSPLQRYIRDSEKNRG